MTSSALAFACLVFILAFGAAVLGMFLHTRLPDHHVSSRSQDVIKLVMGLIATISALVLSLLIASAKSSYDTQRNGTVSLSVDIIAIDRTLQLYGPEADPAREALRAAVRNVYDRLWSGARADIKALDPDSIHPQADRFLAALFRLEPRDETQRHLKDHAVSLAGQTAQLRLLLYEQAEESLSGPFVAILVSWIAALFLGFGLMTRANATVLVALSIGALSVAGAIFLIIELDQPFGGLMRVSGEPIRTALREMGG